MSGGDPIRSQLVALLPKLRRFAVLLTGGDFSVSDPLLSQVCNTMLADPARCGEDMPVHHWALAEIYGLWLEELRGSREVMSRPVSFETMPTDAGGELSDNGEAMEITAFLSNLPPQQRAAVLLVYGEGLSYVDAAKVLDVTIETVASRTSRALATLVECMKEQPTTIPPGGLTEPAHAKQDRALS